MLLSGFINVIIFFFHISFKCRCYYGRMRCKNIVFPLILFRLSHEECAPQKYHNLAELKQFPCHKWTLSACYVYCIF